MREIREADAERLLALQHALDRETEMMMLTVRADNAPARRLYERVGFAVEGVRRASLRVGEEMIDELAMALVWEPPS